MTTEIHKTISGTVPTKSQPNAWLNIPLAILLAAIVLSLFFGGGTLHYLAGKLLLLAGTIHIALHTRWIKALASNTPKNQILFFVLLSSFLLCEASGIARLMLAEGTAALNLAAELHSWSGVTFLGVSLYHILRHRSHLVKRAA